MKDFGNVISLMESIDPQYKKYMSIKREINEAMMEGFSFEKLTELCHEYKEDYSNAKAYSYCLKYMGEEIGRGSSRIVFQIDDYQCLKMGYNVKGIDQNRVEYETTKKINSPLFPYVFFVAPNYEWIVAECVLPADVDDFKQCLGIHIYEFFDIIREIKKLKRNGGMEAYQKEIADYYGDCEFYRNLAKYILDFDIPIGDLTRIENWGLTKRNGKEALVVLDVGFNKEVWKKHYGGQRIASSSGNTPR